MGPLCRSVPNVWPPAIARSRCLSSWQNSCRLQVWTADRSCLTTISFLPWTVAPVDLRDGSRPRHVGAAKVQMVLGAAWGADRGPRCTKASVPRVCRKEVKAWRRPAPPFPSSGTRRPTLRLLRRKGPFVSATTGDNGWCCFRTQPTSPRSERPSLSLSRSWLLSLRSETRN
jgi:hypothetical protein